MIHTKCFHFSSSCSSCYSRRASHHPSNSNLSTRVLPLPNYTASSQLQGVSSLSFPTHLPFPPTTYSPSSPVHHLSPLTPWATYTNCTTLHPSPQWCP